ncbi:MAG TPA: DUF5995 family protein, partial [Kofleriaceae bacterium]|nr:DUF5995 family protein [Kofleriaceae bacterium]
MPDAHDIDGVVAELDRIIATATAEGSRIGLFAALYRQVTLRVRQGIARGLFEDGPRMAMLDTVFANRYLEALAAWQTGGSLSKSWWCAFEASRRTDLILLQHLLLGINAHINLDLGVAAATICPGATLAPLHTDFDRINQILASLTDEVKHVVARFSPMLHLLEEIPADVEDAMINFSMTIARDDAWQHAALLAAQAPPQQGPTIALIDAKTAFLGRLIADPAKILTTVLDAVHLGESRDIPAVITALNAIVTA